MPSKIGDFEQISKAILSGDGIASTQAAERALESGKSYDEIVINGILKAWSDFGAWYERDTKEALKAWFDCFNATQKVLKCLESKAGTSKEPPFSVLVVTVFGEGHVLTRDIVASMLRIKGLKVYCPKKGVKMNDVSEALSDPQLNFVVLSCTEQKTLSTVQDFIRSVKELRKDVAVIAGGRMANESGADLVLKNLSELGHTILGYSENA